MEEPSFTSTLKFEVEFVSNKNTTLDADKVKILQNDLTQVMNDLMGTINRAAMTWMLVKKGVYTPPLRESTGEPYRPDDRNIFYTIVTNAFAPMGPSYRPSTLAVSSIVLSSLAGDLEVRMKTDYQDVELGKKSFPTFREQPIGLTNTGFDFDSNYLFDLAVWPSVRASKKKGTSSQDNHVYVRPVNPTSSHKEVLKGILAGVYKKGNAKLIREESRRGGRVKWYMTLTYSGTPAENKSTLDSRIMGIDLGVRKTVTLAFMNRDGVPLRNQMDTPAYTPGRENFVLLQGNVLRSWNRIQSEVRDRSYTNRKEYGLREGKGLQRKLRVTQDLRSKHLNLKDTAINVLASVVVQRALSNNVKIVVMESLGKNGSNMTADIMDNTEVLSGRLRAKKRVNYLQWSNGKLRSTIESALQKKGILVYYVNPRYTSKKCSKCGEVYHKASPTGGRVRQDLFLCSKSSCLVRGKVYSVHADYNAACNVAKDWLLSKNKS